jgi:aryl carrier-like protein
MEKELPEYMIPSFFYKIDSIPVTVNGKVNKNALPAITSFQQNPSTNYKAPTTEQEQLLEKVWKKVLGRNTIGINDSFFELGGDSIKAIQVVSGMYQSNYRLEVRDLFQYPTIEELAPRMEIITQTADQGKVCGEISLTPIQQFFFENYKEDRHYYNQFSF